ncbi:Hypothetical predicted protein [Paramuricea clavata]|uniref:Uncharacterized protein n=1 Tax=Paramuricea clavata TaxID=317549 RepID=A0A6S7HIA2_PARCT|nr:Hypothetical predicted protein [Paramuricea clavata]
METWNNIAGNEIWMMTSNSRYPNKPDTTVKLASLESPRSGNNLPDSYGLRMTTYYKAPETGAYTFYVSGDDQCQLSIGTDENPDNLKLYVLFPRGLWTNVNQFDKNSARQTTSPIQLQKGRVYFIEALMKDTGGPDHIIVRVKLPSGIIQTPVSKDDLYTSPPADAVPTPPSPYENGAIMDIWRNIGRSDLAPLLADPRYPAKPYTSNKMPGLVSPANIGDNYGLRFKTFYVAPETGSYTFYGAGDDQCRLSISSDDNPKNLNQILQFKKGLWTNRDEWEKDPSQTSSPVQLEKGKIYYMEALLKEGGGGDHIAVGVKLPSGSLQRPISQGDIYIRPPVSQAPVGGPTGNPSVRVKVDIISEGCNDPGIRGCGMGSIRINGIERSYRKRGYNFVVLDFSTDTPTKEELPEVRKSYQEFLHSLRSNSKSPEEEEQGLLFEKVNVRKDATKKDDLKVEDISSEEEQSFYQTAELMDVSPIALNTGRYDTDSKRLRTCSLPDLRLLFETVTEDECVKLSTGEGEGGLVDCDNIKPSSLVNCEDDDDPGQEVDIDIACEESDEESQDYISMLASMEDVLVSDARSPSPIKTVRNLDTTCTSDDDSDSNDDSDSQSSTPLPLNEDWDSGDSDDEESHNESKQEDKDSVFARLEESRKMLEDELGFSRFMKVYKYIQVIKK